MLPSSISCRVVAWQHTPFYLTSGLVVVQSRHRSAQRGDAPFIMLTWYSIDASNIGTGSVRVFLGNEIGATGQTLEEFEMEIQKLAPGVIDLEINSVGGNLLTGLGLIKILKRYAVHNVTITGKCLSTAVLPALCGERICMASDAHMMIHAPVGYGYGHAEDLLDVAIAIEQARNQSIEFVRQRTGQPACVVADWFSKDTWLTAAEALQLGLVNEIFEIPAPRVPRARKTDGTKTNPPPTQDEALFHEWLAAFGKITVNDKEKLIRELHAWAFHNVCESNP